MCWLNLDPETENDCENCINKEYCKKLSKINNTEKDK